MPFYTKCQILCRLFARKCIFYLWYLMRPCHSAKQTNKQKRKKIKPLSSEELCVWKFRLDQLNHLFFDEVTLSQDKTPGMEGSISNPVCKIANKISHWTHCGCFLWTSMNSRGWALQNTATCSKHVKVLPAEQQHISIVTMSMLMSAYIAKHYCT